jgi:Chaperone of endosialidase/Secretion system C-terminal sorting domain
MGILPYKERILQFYQHNVIKTNHLKNRNMNIKKIILGSLIATSFFYSDLALAQLKVNSNGNVGIGTLSPIVKLHVTGNAAIFTSTSGVPTSCAFIRCNNGYSTPSIPDYTWWNNDQTGMYHPSIDVVGFVVAGSERMRIEPSGNVGIGTTSPGAYKLYVNGSAFCTGSWIGSDKRYKTNINPIDEALNKIVKLKGVNYEFRRDQFKNLNFNAGKNLGFIAQELKEVLPEAVKIDTNGYYSINYDQVIPVLVEAVKEQNKKIVSLESQLSYCCTSKQAINTNANSLPNDRPRLLQNNPNPFSQQTNIGYYLPKDTKSASVIIFDMQGKLIKTIAVSVFENASLTINANELSAGMFMYSLVADGKEVDSKRMILTQ